MSEHSQAAESLLADAAELVPPLDYRWTQEVAEEPLPDTNIVKLKERTEDILAEEKILLPDQDLLVRRCISSLLVGHLILQGPPGSGKTSLARALARAFSTELITSTATSEWSPFHVVGGLRPNSHGGLEPALGTVSGAVLSCAKTVRNALSEDPESTSSHIASWLLIDEFNRADIDKAVGSLYTLLSSSDPIHVSNTPIDLWFSDNPNCKYLWVPARFRIIGTMNDLDTNYVSPMSQGLKRRFHFVTVGVPTEGAQPGKPISDELHYAFAGAVAWLSATYSDRADIDTSDIDGSLACLQRVLDGLRRPASSGVLAWPLGTAQIVDVLKVLLLSPAPGSGESLDFAIADRLVAQMNAVSKAQYEDFKALFEQEELTASARELKHLYRPYAAT